MSDFENNDIMEEEDDDIIVLEDENGEQVEFEFGDNIELDGEMYSVLIPLDEGDSDVVILHIESEDEDSGECTLGPVGDEATLNKVFDIFKKNHADEFNFE